MNDNQQKHIACGLKFMQDGEHLLERGYLEGAVESFELAIEINPPFPRPYYLKGVALYRMNRMEEAEQVWAEAWDREWRC
jgi:Flp pilus assembly protein TadD